MIRQEGLDAIEALVYLTDDEVLAIAVHVGNPWPSPLPTTDSSSIESLRDAATRGWRSLSVRGLLDQDDPDEEALLASFALLGGERLARTFLSEDGATPANECSVTTFHRISPGLAVVEVTDVTGVHALGFASDAAVFSMIEEVAASVYQNDDPNAGELTLCVLSAGDSGIVALRVERRSVISFRREGDGLAEERREGGLSLLRDLLPPDFGSEVVAGGGTVSVKAEVT